MSSSYEDAIAAITPFDPSKGIAFKYGMLFSDREGELRSLEKVTGFRLPVDFRDMLGEYCSGHFDGHYRVSFRQRVEIQLDGFMLMRVAEATDQKLFEQKVLNPAEQVVEVIDRNPDLFGVSGSLSLFPFGLSAVHDIDREAMSLGYLCFDPAQANRIIFVAGRELRVAFGPMKGHLIPSFLPSPHYSRVPGTVGRKCRNLNGMLQSSLGCRASTGFLEISLFTVFSAGFSRC